jgi:hypothetical protein
LTDLERDLIKEGFKEQSLNLKVDGKMDVPKAHGCFIYLNFMFKVKLALFVLCIASF